MEKMEQISLPPLPPDPVTVLIQFLNTVAQSMQQPCEQGIQESCVRGRYEIGE